MRQRLLPCVQMAKSSTVEKNHFDKQPNRHRAENCEEMSRFICHETRRIAGGYFVEYWFTRFAGLGHDFLVRPGSRILHAL